ncbi:shikimate kinase [Paremcibacter congregatus]|uniref:Shikimate kinase n=1 Tax=Paremcibacter congregatus TaxID=2043170 RepID=A0A2G4YPP0_9PROT|nr:shikimate kinase [Paremcibacter congregatus]PHZ84257.1 shikimate kinase [Paremcibacter congregatus]QDE29008.1 shikimate kinase [Paremcibacter congregatus]
MRRYKKNKVKSPSVRLRYPLTKSISLVGLMGSGKTTVGVRLARKLGVAFVDSDAEIEVAAGHTVSEIFEKFGEDDFRNGERKVIDRLISDKPMVLGTGGGAFMDRDTRKNLKDRTITVWLKANIDLLVERTSRRDTRPLLRAGNPEKILRDLAKKRYPIYGQADITVETGVGPHEKVVNDIIAKLNDYLAAEKHQQDPNGPRNTPQKVRQKHTRRYPPKKVRPQRSPVEKSPGKEA